MATQINEVFAQCKEEERPCFIGYVTAGFPSSECYIDVLLSLQTSGVDIIEVGIPYTDPTADGPTIQQSNQKVINNGITSIYQCLDFVKEARSKGLSIPVIFMGYYNTLLVYGEEKVVNDCAEAQVNGFIIVDLPPEESSYLRNLINKAGLSLIPLIAPTTPSDRIEFLCKEATSFIYCVSVTGVTGCRKAQNASLPDFINRIREHSGEKPLALGFGVSERAHYENFGKMAEGVVVGSAIIKTLDAAHKEGKCVKEVIKKFMFELTGKEHIKSLPPYSATCNPSSTLAEEQKVGKFGEFGGRYSAETLMPALSEIENCFRECQKDPKFIEEFTSYYQYVGRPSSCHKADRLTELVGGAQIYLKREDLNHTGSHKINNAIGQILMAKRLGKKRIIAETGAGQHGVATATVCAKFGYDLTVYMGAEDVARQALNVFRMEMLGAKVVPVKSGSATLKDAINEAMRDWVTNIETTHYLIGSAIGPHPFPEMVREFQSVIGKETKVQMKELTGRLPDAVVACVGGGSNAIGMFHPFIEDKEVAIVGVEAGGDGVDTGKHSSTLVAGVPGVLHGTRTYILQDKDGQVSGTHSISAGLDYPGVGPEHAHLKFSDRAQYVSVTDKESLIGFQLMSRAEGIIPALETSHAIYHAIQMAKTMPKDKNIVICMSGRGDKDVDQLRTELPKFGLDPRVQPPI